MPAGVIVRQDDAGGVAAARELTPEERAAAVEAKVAAAAPIGKGIGLIIMHRSI